MQTRTAQVSGEMRHRDLRFSLADFLEGIQAFYEFLNGSPCVDLGIPGNLGGFGAAEIKIPVLGDLAVAVESTLKHLGIVFGICKK